MEIRLDYIAVVIVVVLTFTVALYLMDSVFESRYKTESHRYDTEFENIKRAFENKNYEQAIVLSGQIVEKEDLGNTEIRAKAYIGLSKLALNETAEATVILEYLINQYPGIEMVYGSWFKTNRSTENIATIYKSILTDFIPDMEKSLTKKMTLGDMYDAMELKHWVGLLSLLIASVAVYEKIRKKLKGVQ